MSERATGTAGSRAEDQALALLQRAGLILLQRNYRCRLGEIDLIMREGATLVFVEVRFRRSDAFGGPAASVDGRKQRRILTAAQRYLQSHPQASNRPCRFDVVAICPQSEPALDWIRDAFRAG